MTKFWVQGGKLVLNAEGLPILCETCPCGGAESIVYVSGDDPLSPVVNFRMLDIDDLSVLESSQKTALDIIRATDTAGNIYWVRSLFVRKASSISGALTWEYSDTTNWGEATWLDVDASRNVYVAAYHSTNNNGAIVKLNSSGAEEWTTLINHPTRPDTADVQMFGIAVDSSGNSCIVGYYNDPESDGGQGQVVRYYNSSGVEQWNADDDSFSNRLQGRRVAFDSLGNAYVGYRDLDATGEANTLEKFNSAGVSQWTKALGNLVLDLAIDADDNLIVLYDDGSSSQLRKYAAPDHSTISWTTTPARPTFPGFLDCIEVDTDGFVFHTSQRVSDGSIKTHRRYNGSTGAETHSGDHGNTLRGLAVWPGRHPNFI